MHALLPDYSQSARSRFPPQGPNRRKGLRFQNETFRAAKIDKVMSLQPPKEAQSTTARRIPVLPVTA
jgi:hypothetical protein